MPFLLDYFAKTAEPQAYIGIFVKVKLNTKLICIFTYEDDGSDGEADGAVDDNGGGETDLLLLGESLGVAGSSVAKTNCVRMLRHLSTGMLTVWML